MASTQSQKVRVIAKIRGYSHLELESGAADLKPWISVHKPGGGDEFHAVAISFGDNSTSRKESYDVHYCYERDEGNATIFEKEVKPLISEVISGHSATVIAYGARGSGKTHLIQGSEDESGCAVLAMAEVLSAVEESGNLVTISMYEIDNERAYDLLDHKRPEVFILGNAAGIVQLKGLSQVPVKSMSEFQKLYINKQDKHRQPQKISSSALCRNHRGLIIHVFHKETFGPPLGKMNFVDLAAYEDARRKSIDGPSLSKINKAIYALQNVVYALNANESHVPYRESRLTRMLQDSLGGTNRILMVACLNPSFCQDSATVASLASRVCQVVNKFVPDSTKKSKSINRSMVHSSYKSRMLGSTSTGVSKQISSRGPFSEKKTNRVASKIKARKLFDEACQSTKLQKSSQKVPVQESSVLDIDRASLVASPCDDSCEVMPSLNSNAALPIELQKSPKKDSMQKSSVLDTIQTNKHGGQERGSSPLLTKRALVANSSEKVPLPCEGSCEQVISSLNSTTKAVPIAEEGSLEKENNSPLVCENGSPRISERMQELSNNLKLLCASIPSYVQTLPKKDNMCIAYDSADILVPKNDLQCGDHATTDIPEPKTPDPTPPDHDYVVNSNPWHTFSVRSAGMKNCLVQEYLRFLNTADKEELKRLKGIGEKRASYIVELRDESPEPFKNLDDLKEIGLSAKQMKAMMKKELGGLFC